MPPVEIKTLERFKELLKAFAIRTIYCLFEENPKGDPPIGMRLYFYREKDIYYLVDYASGGKLKVTSIPVRVYSGREPYISEEDVEEFVNRELAGVAVNFDFEI